MSEDYLARIGTLIRDARRHKDMTQSELAEKLSTSQSAVARIEQGRQNMSLEMLARIGEAEILARGPKSVGALRRYGLRELWAPESEEFEDVLDHLRGRDLTGPQTLGHRDRPALAARARSTRASSTATCSGGVRTCRVRCPPVATRLLARGSDGSSSR